MKKIDIQVNRLIIRKNLLKEIKKKNIPKITPEAVDFFIHETELFISEILSKAKENMDISARKTMQKEDFVLATKQIKEEIDL